MQKSLPPHVYVNKNGLVRFPITPRTFLENFELGLPCENLFDGNRMRRTEYFRHSLENVICKNLWILLFWLQTAWKLLSGSFKIKKSPPPYVCYDKNRFTRRTTTPFVSADSPGPKEVFKKKIWVLKSIQNFFHAQQHLPCFLLKHNFLHVISA